jgi:hypothetical protein
MLNVTKHMEKQRTIKKNKEKHYKAHYKFMMKQIENAIDENKNKIIYTVPLFDIDMDDYNGLECVIYITEQLPKERVLMSMLENIQIIDTTNIYIEWDITKLNAGAQGR